MSLYASGPATKATAITPSDDTVFAVATRAIYVGVAGNIAVRTANGDSVTLTGVPAGSILPISVDKVMATNTTATTMLALW